MSPRSVRGSGPQRVSGWFEVGLTVGSPSGEGQKTEVVLGVVSEHVSRDLMTKHRE